jgi:hypothetical protein
VVDLLSHVRPRYLAIGECCDGLRADLGSGGAGLRDGEGGCRTLVGREAKFEGSDLSTKLSSCSASTSPSFGPTGAPGARDRVQRSGL